MLFQKNYPLLLLALLLGLVSQATIKCTKALQKQHRIDSLHPFDAASALDIIQTKEELLKLEKLNQLKKETQKLNPNTTAWFLNFVYNPQKNMPKTNFDKKADEEVRSIFMQNNDQ